MGAPGSPALLALLLLGAAAAARQELQGTGGARGGGGAAPKGRRNGRQSGVGGGRPGPTPLTAALLAPGELRCGQRGRWNVHPEARGGDSGPRGMLRRGLTPAPEPLSVCLVRLHETGGHPCGSGTELFGLLSKRPEPVPGARASLRGLPVRPPLVGAGPRGNPRSGMQGSPSSGAGSGPRLCRSRRCGGSAGPARRRGRSWSATARGWPRGPRGFPGPPRARRSRDTPPPL